jgi:hypothetical protein
MIPTYEQLKKEEMFCYKAYPILPNIFVVAGILAIVFGVKLIRIFFDEES